MKRNVLAAAMSRALLCALVTPISFAALAADAPADASPDPDDAPNPETAAA